MNNKEEQVRYSILILFLLSLSFVQVTSASLSYDTTKVLVASDGITDNDLVYSGELLTTSGIQSNLITYNNSQYITYINNNSYVIVGKKSNGIWSFKNTTYSIGAMDTHKVPVIGIDSIGYIHLSWGLHVTQLNYARSNNSENISEFSLRTMTGTNETEVTYPRFFTSKSNLFFSYRGGSSSVGNQYLNIYNVTTQNWTILKAPFIVGGGYTPYIDNFVVGDDGTIHISWMWRTSNIPIMLSNYSYAYSDDNGTTWKNITGKLYTSPINYTDSNISTFAFNSVLGLINTNNMYIDSNNLPHIAYSKSVNGNNNYFHTWYNGTSWNTSQITYYTHTLSGVFNKMSAQFSRPNILINRSTNLVYIFTRDSENGKIKIYTSNFPYTDWDMIYLGTNQCGWCEFGGIDYTLWNLTNTINIVITDGFTQNPANIYSISSDLSKTYKYVDYFDEYNNSVLEPSSNITQIDLSINNYFSRWEGLPFGNYMYDWNRTSSNNGLLYNLPISNGGVIRFTNTSEQYIDILNSSKNFSNVTIISKMNSISNGSNMVILGKDNSAISRVWQFRKSSTDKVEFIPFNASSFGDIIGTSDISDGTNKIIAATYNSSYGSVFVNGNIENSIAMSGALRANTINTTIAKYSGALSSYYTGDIYYIWLFDYALTPTQISNMYSKPYKTNSNVVKFNQTSSTNMIINRTRLVYTGHDSINNISLSIRKNINSDWEIIQSNITSETWIDTLLSNTIDYNIQLNGNGSTTPLLLSLEYDETTALIYNGTGLSNNITQNGVQNYSRLVNMSLDNSVNAIIIPSSDYLNVTIQTWYITGDYYKKWNESSINPSITTQHTIGDFPANTKIRIKVDGISVSNITSDASGYISFNYVGGYSEHQFETLLHTTDLTENIAISKSQSCSGINSYITIVVPLFGLALMIFSIVIVYGQLRLSEHINPVIISTAIIVSIVGFGMLMIGNYLIYNILNVTGC